jgi:RHS repeat-associated protein
VTNGVLAWNPARPTGFGAVPGYRPLPLADGANIALASAWRGKWADITGYYGLGLRPYDPLSGRWLTYDSIWNEGDPNCYSFCGGDPINGFDADGRLAQNYYNNEMATINGFSNPDTANQTFVNSAWGAAKGVVDWLTGAVQSIYSLSAQLDNYIGPYYVNPNPPALSYGDKILNDAAPGFGIDPNSPPAQFVDDTTQGALTLGTLFTPVGEEKAGVDMGADAFENSIIDDTTDATTPTDTPPSAPPVTPPTVPPSTGGGGAVIGLGLDDDLSNLQGTGAIIYKNGGWQQAGLTTVDWGRAIMDNWVFQTSFNQAAQNSSGILFDVSSFDPAYAQPGLTSWEFNSIVSNPSLMGKTTFIQNGTQVFWNGTTFVKP